MNFRYSYRSAQPLSFCAQGVASYCITDTTPSQAPFVAGPSDRVRAGRLGRRSATPAARTTPTPPSTCASRASSSSARRSAIEPILEVFNLFNSTNILVPQTTNLIFNFDGTIRAGLGDPRQVQIGARLIW